MSFFYYQAAASSTLTSVLDEKQYESQSKKIAEGLSGVKITKIRKILKWNPVPYKAYLNLSKDYFDSNSEGFSEPPKPYFVETTFDINYFPSFCEEFYEHFNYLNRKFAPKTSDYEGYISVFSDNYPSLVHARFELTNALTDIWNDKDSLKNQGMMVVDPQYYIAPVCEETTPPTNVKILLTVSVLSD